MFEFDDLGPRALPGFAEAPHAWQVIGESGVVSRFEALRTQATPLIGRDEELDLLSRCWRQAKAGEGRVVLISGEPGIGKSRLTAALVEGIAGEPHTRLRYFCSPHHQDSALYPFIVQLERTAEFARDDTPEAKLGKLEALVAGDAAGPDEITLIAELLSLPNAAAELDVSPQRKREKLLAALLHRLEALARSHPVLMVFEDAHWIDPTSRELLDLTVGRIRRLPVLLLVTFRPELAAHHYGEAAMAVKAASYWLLAGTMSVAKSAAAEAIAQLRRGLGLLQSLPETPERSRLELDLHIPMISALRIARGSAHGEVFAALERSRQLVAATAATGKPLHLSVLYGMWMVDRVRGNAERTLEHAQEFLSLAEIQQTPAPRVIGHRILGTGQLSIGDFRQARPHLELAVSLYRAEEHREFAYGHDTGASALCYLSWAIWHDGYPDQAKQTADRALLHAGKLGHTYTLAYARCIAQWLAVLSRDVLRVERLANENATIAGEHGFPLVSAWSDVLLGWAATHRGQGTDGIDRMRRGITVATAIGARMLEALHLGLVAEALAFAGEVEDGLAEFDQALARSTASGEKWMDAELHRLRGELMCRLPRPDPDGAERCFAVALSIAREQGTKGFELRAATSLARLWDNHGRREEARQLLAPVYDWFTEGFDTVDLKEAKALLAELA